MIEPTAPSDAATPDERQFEAHRASVKPLRLLVVDDQSSSRMVMQYMLNRGGHQAKICANGDRALELIADEVFDAVLLDVHMPGMSGIELVRELRALDHQEHSNFKGEVPVLFMSGDFTPAARAQIDELGAAACLSKPVAAPQLLAALAAVKPR